MSDFVSGFWSGYVALLTLASVLGCGVLLFRQRSHKAKKGEQIGTTGHVWDEDLSEWNNPLPKWWSNLFYITIVFALVYLALYPGLGSFGGMLGWSSRGQFEEETKTADAKYGPIFEKFLQQDVAAVAGNAEAQQMGQRLFLTYCSQCHGSDARGARGFPNLTDNDWQYGGEPEAIKTSIAQGRVGQMPPLADAIGGDQGVKEMVQYVLSLSGKPHDAALASAAQSKFAICAGCHGPDGKGNPAIGAPNLTDGNWLYGPATEAAKIIEESIRKGRNGVMPAWGEKLSPAKVHLLTSYVYGLGRSGRN